VSGSYQILPELEELANEIGDFICYWGFKKIHGRIWTHIYLSESPLDAGQLMQRLCVSKALISLSLNDLLKFEVLLEAGKSARGTQTYVSNPNILNVILNVLRRRERRMLSQAESCFRLLMEVKPDMRRISGIEEERLQSMGTMIRHAQSALTSVLDLSMVDLSHWTAIKSED